MKKFGRLPERPRCPACGEMIDAYSGVGHKDDPSPGDYSVCIYCATILRFGEHLEYIVVPSIWDVETGNRERIMAIRRACRAAKELRQRRKAWMN